MGNKFDIAREYSVGFTAGINTMQYEEHNGEHWKAGFTDGYKMKAEKNRLLNVYLESIGVEKIGTVKICEGR